jgi:RNA-directed DNA polymerase
MTALRKRYARLHLKVNDAKSAVARAFGRKFLGYCLWAAPGGEVKRAVAAKAKAAFKQRVRWLTKRNRGRSMERVVRELRGYVLGWKAYFHLAQTPRVMRELDEWLRHRLRALQLKQWRRGTTIYREPLADPNVHERVALRAVHPHDVRVLEDERSAIVKDAFSYGKPSRTETGPAWW